MHTTMSVKCDGQAAQMRTPPELHENVSQEYRINLAIRF